MTSCKPGSASLRKSPRRSCAARSLLSVAVSIVCACVEFNKRQKQTPIFAAPAHGAAQRSHRRTALAEFDRQSKQDLTHNPALYYFYYLQIMQQSLAMACRLQRDMPYMLWCQRICRCTNRPRKSHFQQLNSNQIVSPDRWPQCWHP